MPHVRDPSYTPTAPSPRDQTSHGGLRCLNPKAMALCLGRQNPARLGNGVEILAQTACAIKETDLPHKAFGGMFLDAPLPESRDLPMARNVQKRPPGFVARTWCAADIQRHFGQRPDFGKAIKFTRRIARKVTRAVLMVGTCLPIEIVLPKRIFVLGNCVCAIQL